MTSIRSRVRRSQTFLLALLASGAVFTAGCANMATTAVGGSGDAVTLGGRIHGGNQPVSGATVNLWFAGQGISSPAVLAATTTSANDGSGSFSFASGSYTCPANNPYVYVVATGGNTQGSGSFNNTAAVFLAPYGKCSTLTASSFVDMTEVTTVATMAALQQYFVYSATAPVLGQTFDTGGSGLAYQSMGLAFNLIPNMVNVATGTAVTSKTINGSATGVGSSGTSVVATPETSKINTIANILASCVNGATSSAPGCTTLFANAAPPASASTTAQPGATYSCSDEYSASCLLHALQPHQRRHDQSRQSLCSAGSRWCTVPAFARNCPIRLDHRYQLRQYQSLRWFNTRNRRSLNPLSSGHRCRC